MARFLHVSACLLALSALTAPVALADPADVAVTISGTLEQTHTDTLGGPRPITFLSTAHGPQAVTFAGDQPVPPGGAEVALSGRLADDTLAVDSATVTGPSIVVPTSGSSGPGNGGTALADSQGTPLAAGVPRKLAVVLISFASPGAVAPALSDATIQSTLVTGSNSVSSYFDEQSGGKVSFTLASTDIHRVTIAANGSGCNDDGSSWHTPGWMTWGNQAATAAGLRRSQYGTYTDFDHVIYVFDSHNSCGWAGLGYMPGDEVYIDNAFTVPVIAHELGHNLGVHHASTLRCIAGGQAIAFSSASSACSSNEYGDPYDVMGNSQTPNHENAFHKLQSGWLDQATRTQTITASGSYTIAPDEATSGVSLLLVPNVTAGTESNAPAAQVGNMFALDFRQPSGSVFDNFAAGSPATSGIQIHLVQTPGGSPIQTQLIDTTPATSSFADAALTEGSTFVDSTDGITILTTDVNPLGATVRVTFGPTGGSTGGGTGVTPPDTSAPTGVPSLTATPASGPVVSLVFGAATDDRAVSGYQITRDGIQIDNIPAAQTTYADWGTTYGTHTYGVTPVDTTGNIGPTATVVVVVSPPETSKPVVTQPATPPRKTPGTSPTTPVGTRLGAKIAVKVAITTVDGTHARRAALSWRRVAGAHAYVVMRNGKKLRTTSAATLLDRSPPRGALRYTVVVAT